MLELSLPFPNICGPIAKLFVLNWSSRLCQGQKVYHSIPWEPEPTQWRMRKARFFSTPQWCVSERANEETGGLRAPKG